VIDAPSTTIRAAKSDAIRQCMGAVRVDLAAE
jgi:hypothetical protein